MADLKGLVRFLVAWIVAVLAALGLHALGADALFQFAGGILAFVIVATRAYSY